MPTSLTPLLAPLWTKNQPLMRERLGLLEAAVNAPADQALRQEAISIAHKMAGSLGMFGFPRGTELARQLEVGLEAGSLSLEAQLRLIAELRAELFPAQSEQA